MKKVIIAGGRDFADYDLLERKVIEFYKDEEEMEIVSGKARGADSLGEIYAIQHGVSLKIFPAEWDKYGKSAGMIRNGQMADYADEAIVFWDGKSPGSRNMIQRMRKLNKKCNVVLY